MIGTSFAGIFHDNCQPNGLLTISLGQHAIDSLVEHAATPGHGPFTVDLPSQTIHADGLELQFHIDPLRKEALMLGLDFVQMTLRWAEQIRAFEAGHFVRSPWLADTATRSVA